MGHQNGLPLDTPAWFHTRGNMEGGRAAMFGPLSRLSPSGVGTVIGHRRDEQHSGFRRSYCWSRTKYVHNIDGNRFPLRSLRMIRRIRPEASATDDSISPTILNSPAMNPKTS